MQIWSTADTRAQETGHAAEEIDYTRLDFILENKSKCGFHCATAHACEEHSMM